MLVVWALGMHHYNRCQLRMLFFNPEAATTALLKIIIVTEELCTLVILYSCPKFGVVFNLYQF